MRIYLDARNITSQPAGVGRYAQCLIPELVRQAPQYDFVVIRHTSHTRPLAANVSWEEVFVDQTIGLLPDFVRGASLLRRQFARLGQPDIYHNLFHISPLLVSPAGCKHVVTLHDFIWVDYPKQSQGTWLKAAGMYTFGRTALPHTLKKADHVIAISNATANRAQQWISPDKMSVIGHGVEEKYFESYPQPDLPWSNDLPYILAVANDKPYKNLGLILEAMSHLKTKMPNIKLVLVGRCDGLTRQIEHLGLTQHVYLPGFLTENALMRMLNHASVFVFPSLVEGFGLPPLEAMAMGVPTIVSDVAPMRDVVGDAALKIDPYNAPALAQTMLSVLSTQPLQQRLKLNGIAHARRLNWASTAKKTLEVYGHVV